MKRGFPTRWYLWAFACILLLALSPFLAGIFAEGMATLAGCDLHASPAQNCSIMGRDYHRALYTIGMLTWLAPLALVCGLIALAIWALLLALHLLWRRI